jgi:hypothetical protein
VRRFIQVFTRTERFLDLLLRRRAVPAERPLAGEVVFTPIFKRFWFLDHEEFGSARKGLNTNGCGVERRYQPIIDPTS